MELPWAVGLGSIGFHSLSIAGYQTGYSLAGIESGYYDGGDDKTQQAGQKRGKTAVHWDSVGPLAATLTASLLASNSYSVNLGFTSTKPELDVTDEPGQFW